jgi:O-antigen biosynthesis protein WbqP
VEREKYNVNSVLSGLMGWAQVNGRDELPIPVKAKLDVEYIKNISLYLDIKCFLLTVFCVLSTECVKEGCQKSSLKS